MDTIDHLAARIVAGARHTISREDAAALIRAHVEAENAKLREDAARLDWLMEKADWHTRMTMFGQVREYRFATPTTTPTIKVREAIDAARNAETLKVRLEDFPVTS